MSHVIQWDSSWLRWPDQCRMISDAVAYRPACVLELTISIEVWLHPEEEPRSRLMFSLHYYLGRSFGSGSLALGVTWVGLVSIPSVIDFTQVWVMGGSTSSLLLCAALQGDSHDTILFVAELWSMRLSLDSRGSGGGNLTDRPDGRGKQANQIIARYWSLFPRQKPRFTKLKMHGGDLIRNVSNKGVM